MTQKTLTNQYEVELHDQILKVCHDMELSLHDNILGSKIFTNYQRVTLIVLFQRSGKALRNFVSELKESRWPRWLGMQELVSKSTLHRWLKKWDLSFLRNTLSCVVVKQQPSLMAVDATGFDSWQRSRHYERRIGAAHIPYAKVDLLVDTKTRLVHDWVLRVKPRHDILGASTMIKRFKHKNVLVLADRGYDSEPLHEIVFASGNLLYAPTTGSFTVCPFGSHHILLCQQLDILIHHHYHRLRV